MFWDDEKAVAKGRHASQTSSFAIYDYGAILLGTCFLSILETEISCIMTVESLSGQLRPRRPTKYLLFGFSEFVHDDNINYLPHLCTKPTILLPGVCLAFSVQHDSRILWQLETRFSAVPRLHTLLLIVFSGLSNELYHPKILSRRISRIFEKLVKLDIGLFPPRSFHLILKWELGFKKEFDLRTYRW